MVPSVAFNGFAELSPSGVGSADGTFVASGGDTGDDGSVAAGAAVEGGTAGCAAGEGVTAGAIAAGCCATLGTAIANQTSAAKIADKN